MNLTKKFFAIVCTFVAGTFFMSGSAHAAWGIVDSLDLSPVIPRVLDALMAVARGGYEYFVGNGDGIIFLIVWGFLAVSIFLYVALMFFPKRWLEFFGISSGGEHWEGKANSFTMAETILKSGLRAIIASIFLLQIKPVYVTEWLVNPFLEFGAVYTDAISDTVKVDGFTNATAKYTGCPEGILSGGWLSKRSCDFLIRPVSKLSAVNNRVIKRGFEFVSSGVTGLISPFVHNGQNIMNVITGVILISTFVSCNMFMALLIIQGIFNFGMALILYPFRVMTWVAKRDDKWLDLWAPFSDIVKALQDLVVTMIACALILIINIAIVRSLFQWNTEMFNVASGGTAISNVPTTINTNAVDFGGHSLLWLSSILTFFLMHTIFEKTREQLNKYVPDGMSAMYNQAKTDFDANVKRAKGIYQSLKKIIGLTK